MDQRLTPSFKLSEFTKTDHVNLRETNAKEAEPYIGTMRRLCVEIMQKIRNAWGPVQITSGFRGPALNKAVGGSASSQHCKGEACDFILLSVDDRDQFVEWAKDEYDCGMLNWHQLLIEPECIHISLPTGRKDGEIGTWEKKKVNGKWKRSKKIIRKGKDAA